MTCRGPSNPQPFCYSLPWKLHAKNFPDGSNPYLPFRVNNRDTRYKSLLHPGTGVTGTPGRARGTRGTLHPRYAALDTRTLSPVRPVHGTAVAPRRPGQSGAGAPPLPPSSPALRGPGREGTRPPSHGGHKSPEPSAPLGPRRERPRGALCLAAGAPPPPQPRALPLPFRGRPAPPPSAATHPTASRTRPLRRLPGPSRSLTLREAAAPSAAQLSPAAPAIFRRCTPPARAVTRGGGSARLRPRPAPRAAATAGVGGALPGSTVAPPARRGVAHSWPG